MKKDNQQVIKDFKKIHENRYDYSKVNYVNTHTNVIIICKKHGEFNQTPHNHLKGRGCSKCNGSQKLTTNEFIKRAIKVHGNKYDYSKTDYQGAFKKVIIICPIHGEFEQVARTHVGEGKNCGCHNCKISKGELKIISFFNENKIEFIPQKRFNDCKDKNLLPFDFYLPKFNSCVEYDGLQHFKERKHFGGMEYLRYIQKHDKIKTEFCKNNNINLLRIKYNENIKIKLKNFLNSVLS